MARPFEVDSEMQLIRSFRYDHVDDSFVIATDQDVTDIVEDAKGRFNQFDERTPWKGDWHHVAEIPLNLYFQLKEQGIIDESDPKQTKLRKWLNDRDNLAFRTRPGRV